MLYKLRIGIQVKSVLILATVVLLATAAGGWMYYAVTREILRRNDDRQADHLTSGLTVAASPGLAENDRAASQRLVNDLLDRSPTVCSVAIIDRRGRTIAKATRVCPDFRRAEVVSEPPSLSYQTRLGESFMEIGRPVLVPAGRSGTDTLVGGVRLVFDTRPTSKTLAGLRREVVAISTLILVLVIPLGQALVWRVLTVPVRRLVRATHQLAQGDFSARTETRRNDEIGELASSFDTMAERLHASQRQLRMANESLERKVKQRTRALQRTNRRLRDEMAEKEDFLRAVSHDLNAPLRNIAGMANMISLKYANALPEEVCSRLQRIQANVDVETNLLSELLELSRVKRRTHKRETVDFVEILEDLKGSFEYELKQKNIKLDIARPMPRLHVEPVRMRQIFQNLIDNAIKYMDRADGGVIEIGYDLSGGMHHFRVADNGPGIAPAEQERIFYVFRRVATAAHANVPGKGVGLALVKSIAEKYDGRAWVESEPGAGSAFHVTLSDRLTREPKESQRDEPAPAEHQLAPVGGSAAD